MDGTKSDAKASVIISFAMAHYLVGSAEQADGLGQNSIVIAFSKEVGQLETG